MILFKKYWESLKEETAKQNAFWFFTLLFMKTSLLSFLYVYLFVEKYPINSPYPLWIFAFLAGLWGAIQCIAFEKTRNKKVRTKDKKQKLK